MKMIKTTLGASSKDRVVLFSSDTGLGRDELWGHILQAIEDAGMSLPVEDGLVGQWKRK